MLTLAAPAEQTSSPTPFLVLIIVLVTGGIIFRFGFLRAVHLRAKSDYIKTKEGLPGMRKTMWQALWAVVKTGFWIFIGVALLITWAGSEMRSDGDQKPVPAKVSPAPTRK